MKTSVIKVHDMLSVLSIEDLEKRINEVPGVESATVNYDAGSATVRYDETRLKAADIKPAVHQASYLSEDESKHKQDAALTPNASKDALENKPATAATKAKATEQTMPAPQVNAPAAATGDNKQDKSVQEDTAKPVPETESLQAHDCSASPPR